MEKEKNKSERLDKSYLIKTISVIERLHDDLMVLQEAYMKEQQSLLHEKWKGRYLTRILKRVAPDQVLSEEELDNLIHKKEH